MDFLKKIQNLPKSKRKIILWTVTIVVGLSLIVCWVKIFQKKLKGFKMEEFKEEFKLPTLEKELKGIPKIEMPEISQEELKKLEEMLKEKPYEEE